MAFFRDVTAGAKTRIVGYIGTSPDEVKNRHRYAFFVTLVLILLIILVGWPFLFLLPFNQERIKFLAENHLALVDPNRVTVVTNLLTALTWFGGIYVGSAALTSLPIFQSAVSTALGSTWNFNQATENADSEAAPALKQEQQAQESTDVQPQVNPLFTSAAYHGLVTAAEIRVAKTYAKFVSAAAAVNQLEPALICAVISRESRWGFALKPQGPEGVGDPTARKGVSPPDGGWGRGLMQIDCSAWEFARSGPWKDPEQNINFGSKILSGNIAYFRRKGLASADPIRAGLAAYNCPIQDVIKNITSGRDVDASTSHGHYSRDVLERCAYFAEIFKSGADLGDEVQLPPHSDSSVAT